MPVAFEFVIVARGNICTMCLNFCNQVLQSPRGGSSGAILMYEKSGLLTAKPTGRSIKCIQGRRTNRLGFEHLRAQKSCAKSASCRAHHGIRLPLGMYRRMIFGSGMLYWSKQRFSLQEARSYCRAARNLPIG